MGFLSILVPMVQDQAGSGAAAGASEAAAAPQGPRHDKDDGRGTWRASHSSSSCGGMETRLWQPLMTRSR